MEDKTRNKKFLLSAPKTFGFLEKLENFREFFFFFLLLFLPPSSFSWLGFSSSFSSSSSPSSIAEFPQKVPGVFHSLRRLSLIVSPVALFQFYYFHIHLLNSFKKTYFYQFCSFILWQWKELIFCHFYVFFNLLFDSFPLISEVKRFIHPLKISVKRFY